MSSSSPLSSSSVDTECDSWLKQRKFEILLISGPFKCYITFFPWKFDPQPLPRNANNVEPFTFVMLFFGKADTTPYCNTYSFAISKKRCKHIFFLMLVM